MIQYAGYDGEIHYVETADGYKLKMHRVKAKRTSKVSRSPVFFMHALGATSAIFLIAGADIALRKVDF